MSTLFVPPLRGGMEIMMKLRAVIFDLDGTLMDTLGDIAAGVSFALRQADRKVPTLAEYRTFIGDGPKVLIQRALGEKIPEAEFEAGILRKIPRFIQKLFRFWNAVPQPA